MNRAAYLKPEDPTVEEIAEAIGFFKEGPLKLNLGGLDDDVVVQSWRV